MPEYRAAVGNEAGTQWIRTTDTQAIVDAPEDLLIFYDNEDELKAAILERCVRDRPNVETEVKDDSYARHINVIYTYAGSDLQELVDILSADAQLNSEGLPVTNNELSKLLRNEGLDLGFIENNAYNRYSYGTCKWRYDPPAAKRKRRREQQLDERRGLAMTDVTSCIYGLQRSIRNVLLVEHLSSSGWLDTAYSLGHTINRMNVVFGRYEYRKHEAFQKLIKTWREANDKGKKRIRETLKLAGMCEWLDEEAARRPPKVRKDWQSKYDLPFDPQKLREVEEAKSKAEKEATAAKTKEAEEKKEAEARKADPGL